MRVRVAETESWRFTWGDDLAVDVALYVRDALALSIDDDLPPVEPAVPVSVPAGIDRAAVQREWPGWWADVLAYVAARGEPDAHKRRSVTPVPADRSAMLHAVEVFTGAASEHLRDRRMNHLPRGADAGPVVRELEASFGRKARPFTMTVTEVSVAGLVWRRLAQNHVLVSARFARDTHALDVALRGLLGELV